MHSVLAFLNEAIVACPARSGSKVVGRVVSWLASWSWSGPNPSEPGRPTRDMDDLSDESACPEWNSGCVMVLGPKDRMVKLLLCSLINLCFLRVEPLLEKKNV